MATDHVLLFSPQKYNIYNMHIGIYHQIVTLSIGQQDSDSKPTLKLVVEQIKQANIKLKTSFCHSFQSYLGSEIKRKILNGTDMDPDTLYSTTSNLIVAI